MALNLQIKQSMALKGVLRTEISVCCLGTHPFLCTPEHNSFPKLQRNMWAPAPKSGAPYVTAGLPGFLSSHPAERSVDVAKAAGGGSSLPEVAQPVPLSTVQELILQTPPCLLLRFCHFSRAGKAAQVREAESTRGLEGLPQTTTAVWSLREAENASRRKDQSLALVWTYSAQSQKYK